MTAAGVLDEVLREGLGLLTPLKDALPDSAQAWYSSLRSLSDTSSGERLRIGVVGVTSSGKSTFINALLGEELLTEQSKATTNVPVICRKGNERILIVAHPGGKTEYRGEAVTAALLKGLCTEDGNPDNAKGIQHLSIALPTCCLPVELEIVDTPGTDAFGFEKHEVTLYECVPGFDIVVFMTHLARPFAASDLKLLSRILEHDQRIVFVISHSDIEQDDHERTVLSRSRQEKLDNHVRELTKKLAQVPGLKEFGIATVSSYHAKLAHGDQEHEDWKFSNFGTILDCFRRFVDSLGDVLVSVRAARVEKIFKRVIAAVSEPVLEFDRKTETPTVEESVILEVNALVRARQEVLRHVSTLRARVATTLDAAVVIPPMLASVTKLEPRDVWGFQELMDRLPKQWDEGVSKATQAIDLARSRCRGELDRLGLPAGRSVVKRRLLDSEDFPSLARRIKKKAEPYEIVVPRTGWFVKLRDRLFGERRVTSSAEVSSVDVEAFKSDLDAYLQHSINRLSQFIDEQTQLLKDLFLEPLEARWNEQQSLLTSLSAIRAAAEAQKASLPAVLKRLSELLIRLEPLVGVDRSQSPPETTTFSTAPAPPSQPRPAAPGDLGRSAMRSVLSRVRESAAINRFWQIARRQSRGTDQPRRMLVVGMEMADAYRLTGYLTRINDPAAQHWAATADGLDETVVSRQVDGRREETRVTVIPNDCLVPSDVVREQCAAADTIAVSFDGAQPSAGLKRLLSGPHYDVVGDFAAKAFVIFPAGATYDYRLHDLVSDVVTMVAERTAFSAAPWYVYEASRYDARYTDFIELVQEVRRRNGAAREMPREWRARGLSTRPPFHEEALNRAYNEVLRHGAES